MSETTNILGALVFPTDVGNNPIRVRFNFGVKARRPSYKCLSLIDFWLRPVGTFEIVAPILKRATTHGCASVLGQKQDGYHANAFPLIDFLLRPVGTPEIFAPGMKRPH